MKNFSINKFTLYVFLAGTGLIVISILIGMHVNNFRKNAISVQGTVIALAATKSTPTTSQDRTRSDRYTYSPVVRFITQRGKAIEFSSDTGTKKAAYKKGDTVEVLYLPSSPEKAKINDFLSLWMMPVVIGGIGLIFFALGSGIIIISKLKGRKNEYLKRNGTPVESDYQSVEKDSNITLGGKNPYKVITQWTDPSTSQTHTFKSDNIWYDPTDKIDRDKITVYMELNNPEIYYVDLTFLDRGKR